MVKYQKYTSEKTDICQITSVFKQNGYPFPRGSLILDYGGGKCNKTIDWMLQVPLPQGEGIASE